MPVLSALYIYPIKSLGGIAVKQWEVLSTGLKYDRRWMLVDEQQQFLSQRHLARMALIKTRLESSQLIVSAPGQADLYLELEPPANSIVEVTVWRDPCIAQAVSQQADQWFSEFLHVNCQLVYQPSSSIRAVNPEYAHPNDRTAFSDGFPFLIVSDASLQKLNQQMGLKLAMERFRPNIVIQDCPSYAEDTWRSIRIGSINFRLPKPCSRCSVPQINPETALSDKEPLKTLALTRKWQNQVYFGQNALHDNQGTLHIGDAVTILSTGPAQPPL